jgi:hypothetical protein
MKTSNNYNMQEFGIARIPFGKIFDWQNDSNIKVVYKGFYVHEYCD